VLHAVGEWVRERLREFGLLRRELPPSGYPPVRPRDSVLPGLVLHVRRDQPDLPSAVLPEFGLRIRLLCGSERKRHSRLHRCRLLSVNLCSEAIFRNRRWPVPNQQETGAEEGDRL
jgi:hypothetical protein